MLKLLAAIYLNQSGVMVTVPGIKVKLFLYQESHHFWMAIGTGIMQSSPGTVRKIIRKLQHSISKFIIIHGIVNIKYLSQ